MISLTTSILCAVLASVISFVVAVPLPKVLTKWKVVDVPNSRSSHTAPTPRGGGWAVAIGSFGAIAAIDHSIVTLLIASWSIASGAIGLVDDLRSLQALHRLAGQLLIGAFGGLMLMRSVTAISTNSATPWPAWVVLPLITIWVASNINAVNFMDGINGITAIHAAISGAFLWWVSVHAAINSGAAAAAICGACIGFLPHNSPVARLFLGDIGSYLIGSWLALTSASIWLSGVHPLVAVAPASVYLADTGKTLLSRAIRRETLFEAHREHTYQKLSSTLRGHLPALVIYATAQATVCGVTAAYVLRLVSGVSSIVLSVVVLALYLLAPFWSRRNPRTN